MLQALRHLDTQTLRAVEEIAGLPDLIRGYDEVKPRSFAFFSDKARLSARRAREDRCPHVAAGRCARRP